MPKWGIWFDMAELIPTGRAMCANERQYIPGHLDVSRPCDAALLRASTTGRHYRQGMRSELSRAADCIMRN